MPFPSSACDTCKRRRIKCDGGLPVCQRCIKSRRECRGIRAGPGSLAFHMENEFASGHQKRPRGPRMSSPESQGGPPPSGPSPGLPEPPEPENSPDYAQQDNENRLLAITPPRRPQHSLQPPPQAPRYMAPPQDLETLAIIYYVNYHPRPLQAKTDVIPTVSMGLDEDMLTMLIARSHEPSVRLAASALALASFARSQNCPGALVAALGAYQRLLRVTRGVMGRLSMETGTEKKKKSLGLFNTRSGVISTHGEGEYVGVDVDADDNGDDDDVDEGLFAIFCMARYEDALHDPLSGRASSSTSHHDGALAMLKAWKESRDRANQSDGVQIGDAGARKKTNQVSSLVKHTRRSMIKSALMRTRPLPDWIRDGAYFGEKGLDNEYDTIIVRLANLRHKLSGLCRAVERWHGQYDGYYQNKDEGRKLKLEAENMAREAHRLELAVQRWRERFSKRWPRVEYQIFSLEPRQPSSDNNSSPFSGSSAPQTNTLPAVNVGYTYPRREHSAVWNYYYALRMIVNSTRKRALDMVIELDSRPWLASAPRGEEQGEAESTPDICASIMREMAHDFALGLPFCMTGSGIDIVSVAGSSPTPSTPSSSSSSSSSSSPLPPSMILSQAQQQKQHDWQKDIKPYFVPWVVWPLSIASGVEGLDQAHQRLFRRTLGLMGRMTGIGALADAEDGYYRWFQL